MPNRVIKESIKFSEQIDSLTWFEEVLFYRLIVSADDYGCYDGRAVLIKSELFPLKENVTKKSVQDAVDKLASVGLLCKYTANDKPYLFFPTWEKHQRLRNQHRKYPDPVENGLTDIRQSNDRQLSVNCMLESEVEKESESESESNTSSTRSKAADFDAFWSAYPKKVGKGDAKKTFQRTNVAVEVLISSVNEQKKSKQWKEGYIPNPATWLRQERWEDDLSTPDIGNSEYYSEGEDFLGR